jgi:hypothetical protein
VDWRRLTEAPGTTPNKKSLMPEIAKLRMKALNFWDKHASMVFDQREHSTGGAGYCAPVVQKH